MRWTRWNIWRQKKKIFQIREKKIQEAAKKAEEARKRMEKLVEKELAKLDGATKEQRDILELHQQELEILKEREALLT